MEGSEAMMQLVVEYDRPKMGLPNTLPGPVEHPDIRNKELMNLGNPRKTKFDIYTNVSPTQFVINKEPFLPNKIHETLTLDGQND